MKEQQKKTGSESIKLNGESRNGNEGEFKGKDTFACLFAICRKYIKRLNGETEGGDLSLSTFKKLLIEKMTYSMSNPSSLVIGTTESISNDKAMPVYFYVTGFSLGTSVFFEMMVDELGKRPKDFAPFLLKCGGSIKERDGKTEWEWIPEDGELNFKKINDDLLEKVGEESLLVAIGSQAPKTDIKYKQFQTVSDKAYNIIKEWICDKTLSSNNYPNAQRIVLLDHIDRFFIEMFQLFLETNGKKGYSLWQIRLLRHAWTESIYKLNKDHVHCAASVLTELEGFWGDMPIDDTNASVSFKRTRVRKQWSRAAESENYFIDILKVMFSEIGVDGYCFRSKTDYHKCPFQQFYLYTPQDSLQWEPDIASTVEELKHCTDGDPRLFFLFCYHAIQQRGENGKCSCIEHVGQDDIPTLDSSLKEYYRDGCDRAKGHTLLEDFLYSLPLYIAESDFSLDALKTITTQWKVINSAFVEGVKLIFNKLGKKWKKAVSEEQNKRDTDQRPSKRSLKKIFLSECQCKKTLMKGFKINGVNKTIRKIFDKNPSSKDCFMRILSGRNILYHKEKWLCGEERYWNFRGLWEYLYTDKKIFPIVDQKQRNTR